MIITRMRRVGQFLPYNENHVVESTHASFWIITGIPDTSHINIGEHEVKFHICFAEVLKCVDKI
jgi:hypothetical protein